jgi:hypothetical protein
MTSALSPSRLGFGSSRIDPLIVCSPVRVPSDPARTRPPWPGSLVSSRWTATYFARDSEEILSGGLILRHAARRLVLVDHDGIAVDVRQLRPSESIGVGSRVDFPFFLAKVGQICVSPVAPTRRPSSPSRPRRSLGPRALFRPNPGAGLTSVDPVRCVTSAGDEVDAPMAGTCTTSGGSIPEVRETSSSRVSAAISPPLVQISCFQHIWDRGKAAGQPRVVFVDQVISPSIP